MDEEIFAVAIVFNKSNLQSEFLSKISHEILHLYVTTQKTKDLTPKNNILTNREKLFPSREKNDGKISKESKKYRMLVAGDNFSQKVGND